MGCVASKKEGSEGSLISKWRLKIMVPFEESRSLPKSKKRSRLELASSNSTNTNSTSSKQKNIKSKKSDKTKSKTPKKSYSWKNSEASTSSSVYWDGLPHSEALADTSLSPSSQPASTERTFLFRMYAPSILDSFTLPNASSTSSASGPISSSTSVSQPYTEQHRQTKVSRPPDAPRGEVAPFRCHLINHLREIYSMPHYWGAIDRFEAESILASHCDGSYLLRDSTHAKYLFTISFKHSQRSQHMRLDLTKSLCSRLLQAHSRAPPQTSRSDRVPCARHIWELLRQYQDQKSPTSTEPLWCLPPVNRTFVFSLKELCRAEIVTHMSYNGVAELRLPPQLILYLQKYHYKVPSVDTKTNS